MPRFKTIGFTRCENGHINRFEKSFTGDSSDIARAFALAEATLARCKFCQSTQPSVVVKVFATKQIPVRTERRIWGYTCHCGERVEVARVEPVPTPIIPATKTVKCSRGHSRTIHNREFPLLERWEGKTE